MKKTNKDTKVETSERARTRGLKRIERRHVLQPGEAKLSDAKAHVTMYLDANVLEYFKKRAAEPKSTVY